MRVRADGRIRVRVPFRVRWRDESSGWTWTRRRRAPCLLQDGMGHWGRGPGCDRGGRGRAWSGLALARLVKRGGTGGARSTTGACVLEFPFQYGMACANRQFLPMAGSLHHGLEALATVRRIDRPRSGRRAAPRLHLSTLFVCYPTSATRSSPAARPSGRAASASSLCTLPRDQINPCPQHGAGSATFPEPGDIGDIQQLGIHPLDTAIQLIRVNHQPFRKYPRHLCSDAKATRAEC